MTRTHYRKNTALMLRVLMQGHKSIAQIAEGCGMSYDTARQFINDLHAAGVVHIAAYTKPQNTHYTMALYTLGIGVDAQKPKAKTPSERSIKYKRKKETQPLKPAPKIVKAPSSVFQLASFQ